MKNCPICESKLKYKAYGEVTTEESYLDCENRCYTETFLYGHTEITVFNKSFQYSYNYSEVELKEITNSIDKEIEYWKKDMRYLGELIDGKPDVNFTFNETIGAGVVNTNAVANITLEELFE